jgi:NAD(P)H-flavin reductase
MDAVDSTRFAKVHVSYRHEETGDLTLLRVEGGPGSLYSEHRHPGQYVAVRLPEAERPGHLAIASAPGDPHFEFLVRGGGRFADALRGLRPTDTVEVSHPTGPGFPLAAARGRDLWMVAAGSAVAALRPVVRMVLAARPDYGRARFLFGVRGHNHVPFKDEMESWKAGGIEVHLAASRPGQSDARTGHHGYVQDLLLALSPDLRGAVVFACGMAPMIEALRTVSTRLGLAGARLFTNT